LEPFLKLVDQSIEALSLARIKDAIWSDLIDGRVAVLEAGATQCRMARPLLPGSSSTDNSIVFWRTLPPHDFSLLAPHLRTVPLERGVMLHDVGEAAM
jgi:hypothetical protein